MLKKIASNTLYQIFAKIWTAIISIFMLSILTNYLTIELFWMYSKIYNYLWIFSFFADLWLYTIAIREISKNDKDTKKIIWNIMSLRLLLWLTIIILSLSIAYFMPWYNSNLAMVSIFIVSIFTIFWLLNSSILSLMQSEMKMGFSLFSTILWKTINLFLIILITYVFFNKDIISNYDNSFTYIMISGLIWVIITTALNYYYANKLCKISFLFDKKYIAYIFKTSLPYWIALFLSVIYFKIDIILLSILEPSKEADISIALYSLPMKIVEVLMIIWGFYLNSILPTMTKLFENKNTKKLSLLLNISFKILFSASIIIFTLWVLFRKNIIEIVANKSYIDPSLIYSSSDWFLVVLSVIIFYFISLIYIYIFIVSKNQSKLLKINIIITIFNIVWNIIMIPLYSFIGAWIVTILSQILLMVLSHRESNKIISFKIPYKFILKTTILSWILYIIWYFLINNYSIWLYFDVLVYWWVLFLIYFLYLYSIFFFSWQGERYPENRER